MAELSTTLLAFRRRLRRVIWLRGAAAALLVLCGGITLLAVADAAWRIEPPVVRAGGLLAVCAAALWTLHRLLVRPLQGSWDDVSLALLIERLRPAQRDRLASAAQFAAGGPAVGDIRMVSQAVQQAQVELEGASPMPLIDRGPAVRAALLLLTLLSIPGLWLWRSPTEAALALERQVAPFTAAGWPRTTRLVLLTETLAPLASPLAPIAADEPLTIYLGNALGELPGDVRLARVGDTGEPEAIELTRTQLRDLRGVERTVAVATLLPAAGRLRLTARGGDDVPGQNWEFDVRSAPRLERYHIRVTPPAYSGLPVVEEQRAAGHVEGLVGSSVVLWAESNVALSEAWFHRDGQPPLAALEPDGRVRARFEIEAEGRATAWFELRDDLGIAAARPPRIEIRGRRDQPPTVHWLQPGGPLTALPGAVLPLQVQCHDDLGVAGLVLEWTEHGASAPRSINWPEDGADAAPDDPRQFDWPLAGLQLHPGASGECAVVVLDSRLPEAQRTSTPPLPLRIVSLAEKRREIDEQQAGLAHLLDRLLQRQGEATESLQTICTQWDIAGTLRTSELAILPALDQERRRLLVDLTDGRVGFHGQLGRIRDQLEWNRIIDPAVSERLTRLARQLEELVSRTLPLLGRELATALQVLDSAAGPGADGAAPAALMDESAVAGALSRVQRAQAAAVATLSAMRQELSDWRRQLDSSRTLEELLSRQQSLQERTAALNRETFSRALADLSPQQQADLFNTAEGQRRLAATLAELLAPTTTDVIAAHDSSHDALPAAIQDGSLAALMTSAAGSIALNQLGTALTAQAEIIAALTAALELTTTTPPSSPDQLLAIVQEARRRTEQLQQRLADLREQTQQLPPRSEDAAWREQLQMLQRGHERVSAELADLEQRLQRRLLTKAARTARRAAAHSRAAQLALTDLQRDGADAAQQQGLAALGELAEELTELETAAERDHLAVLWSTLAEDLRPIQIKQLELLQQVEALEVERGATARLSRNLLQRLASLVRDQRQLESELRRQVERTSGLGLVQGVLAASAEQAAAATHQLEERSTDARATGPQRVVLERLKLLLEALEGSAPAAGENGETPSAAEQGHLASLQELRLLRLLQRDLHVRTQALQSRGTYGTSGANESLPPELETLVREQAALAARAEEILTLLRATPDGQLPASQK